MSDRGALKGASVAVRPVCGAVVRLPVGAGVMLHGFSTLQVPAMVMGATGGITGGGGNLFPGLMAKLKRAMDDGDTAVSAAVPPRAQTIHFPLRPMPPPSLDCQAAG